MVCSSSETWGNWFKQRGVLFFPPHPPIQQLSPLGWKILSPGREQEAKLQQGQHHLCLSQVHRGMEARARKHLEGGEQLHMVLPCENWENGGMGAGDAPPALPLEQSSLSPALLQLWCGLENRFKHSLPLSACVFSQ